MKKKYILISLISFIVLLIGVIIFYVSLINNTKLYLIGDNVVNVDVFGKYKDKGVVLKRGKKVINSSKYKLTKKGKVDTSDLGEYKITYTVKYSFRTLKVERTIKVLDTVIPELSVNVNEVDRDFCSKKIKQEVIYSALDNYDGDITSQVVVEESDDKLIYSITDSSGNIARHEVDINYGKKPKNKFYLNGSNPTHVIVNNEYLEKGASYTDGCGKKIDKEISISGGVDTSIEGTYYINYDVEGEATLTRKVVVEHYTPKTIYLTFDDGPGANTKKILDVLDKYGVKATFFVTNQFPSYQYLIAEEHNRGHQVAVHTYSHKYANIYTSVDDYINDFNMMNEIIKNQTGSYSNIFRFPGGSSNTVSRSYKTGVVTEIANEMTNRGYVYFDWNLSSSDADGKSSTQKIINTVVGKVDKCSTHCVILFHDYKATTAAAIDPILADLTKRGYKFAVLTESSPTVHSKIAN